MELPGRHEGGQEQAGDGLHTTANTKDDIDKSDPSQSNSESESLSASFLAQLTRSERMEQYKRTESGASSMPDAALGAIGDTTHFLKLETIRDGEAKKVSGTIKVIAVLCLAAIVIMGVLKERESGYDYYVLNRSYHVAVLVITVLLAVIVSVVQGRWLRRLAVAREQQKEWSSRRLHALQANALRAVLVYFVLGTTIVQNIIVLADPSVLCGSHWITVFGFLRWTGYNTLLLLLCIDGNNIILVDVPGRTDGMVKDLPWRHHWPKLIYWAIVFGFTLWVWLQSVEDGDQINQELAPGETCTWGAQMTCSLPTAIVIGSSFVCAGFVGWGVWYVGYLVVAFRQLKKRLYQHYRIANMLLQLQFRLNVTVIVVFTVGVLVLWFLASEACSSYIITFFGIVPLITIWCGLHCISLYLTTPRVPADGPPAPLALMQEFAWTEQHKDVKVARRNDAIAERCSELIASPMFCYETAIKTFYWSSMIYHYTEADGQPFAKLPEMIRELLGEVQTGMRLFALHCRKMFYDRVLRTKVLVAWNEKTIIVCARGSAETANFVADAQFLQTVHPPRRKVNGRVPKVHAGFLKSWQSNGVSQCVLDHVHQLVYSAAEPEKVRIVCTGHSLGGAVASLAALDIVKKCKLSKDQVSVYTFGCPRVGNHAFAEEYMEHVPDTWHIINNQDIVVHSMKLFGYYKRAGERIIVTTRGDMIVRPSMMEQSLLQRPLLRSVKSHFNAQYKNALFTVITNQLNATSRHTGGLQGMLELLAASPEVSEALESHATQLGINVRDALGGIVQATSLARRDGSLTRSAADGAASSRGGDGGTPRMSDDGGAELPPVSFGSGEHRDAFARSAAAPRVALSSVPAAQEGPVALQGNGGQEAEVSGSDDDGTDAAQAEGAPDRERKRVTRLRRAVKAAMGQDADGGKSGGSRAQHEHAALEIDAESLDIMVELESVFPNTRKHYDWARKKCYIIPENEDAVVATGALDDRDADGARSPRNAPPCNEWHCPLSAPPEHLPSNARLHGSVVEIGSRPDMKAAKASCKPLNCCKDFLQKDAAMHGNDRPGAARWHRIASQHLLSTRRDPVQENAGLQHWPAQDEGAERAPRESSGP